MSNRDKIMAALYGAGKVSPEELADAILSAIRAEQAQGEPVAVVVSESELHFPRLQWLHLQPNGTKLYARPPIATDAQAEIAELKDDRDSWIEQCSQRVDDCLRIGAERDALQARCEALEKDAKVQPAFANGVIVEAAYLSELEKDAELLAWLNRKVFTKHWNGVVGTGSATAWSIAGDWRHTVAKMEGETLREAIRAAIAQE